MTIPHYGKREPGALTAASPGDTLYFAFASYNDSGDSESLVGLAVTDIEVFKNGVATARATDSGYSLISDTGMLGDRAGLYRFSVQLFNTADDATFYASGSWYQVAVDSVAIDGKTVRAWVGSFEIGRQRVNVFEIAGDTGAANYLKNTFANGFSDTGVQERLARIQSDVDTGLRVHIDDLDTGLKDTLADYDTGLRALLALRDTGAIATAVWAGDTGLRDHITNVDTGITNRLNTIAFDVDTGLRAQISDVDTGLHDTIADLDTGLRGILVTNGVNVGLLRGDTGAANWLKTVYTAGFTDTGLYNRLDRIQFELDTGLRAHMDDSDTGIKDAIADLDTGLRALIALQDTGFVANAVWNSLRSTHIVAGSFGESDTGVNQRFAQIQSDVDTGLRVHIDDLDTGLHAHISDVDTGLHALINAGISVTSFSDTGVNNRLAVIAADTDTGIQSSVNVTAFADTGVNNRLAVILADTDTGIQSGVTVSVLNDTGLNAQITAIKTQTDKLTFDTGNELQADIRKVNGVTVGGAGSSGNPWGPA